MSSNEIDDDGSGRGGKNGDDCGDDAGQRERVR
jgi:hypothetical protein